MGIRTINIAGNNITIHELDNLYDTKTGRPLTGSWLWDSAIFLSRYLSSQNLTHKAVLELGAGSGLPGLTAAHLGAARVVLTDIEPLLPGLGLSVEANGLCHRVEVSRLLWGEEDELGLSHELFDLVLMSDVLYDKDAMGALGKTLRRVCGRETKVWAATEVRPWTSECLSELTSQGFRVVELPSRNAAGCDERFEDFSIFELTRVIGQDGD